MSDTQETTSDSDAFEANREKMRRDHFPVEKGRNQQDLDEYEPDPDHAEDAVKWPEVDSEDALTEKLDEQNNRSSIAPEDRDDG